MKLENEIKQSKSFKNSYHKLAVNLIYTHGWFMQYQVNYFKEHDITWQQYNILRILRGQAPQPVSVGLLKERMLDKMSDASRLVERLRKKGLVERNICKDDRRKVDVVITEAGMKLLDKIGTREDEMLDLFNTLSIEEAAQLNILLDKLRG